MCSIHSPTRNGPPRERADVSRPASLDSLVRPRHDRASPDEPASVPGSSEGGFMSILVIGATGFIGPRLIRRLVARGESVVGMDLNPAAIPFGNVPIGAPVVRGDVTQFEDVMRTILDAKPERVINLAYGLGMGEGNPPLATVLDILVMDNVL